MLVEFRVENHRSLRDEQVFTMAAAPGADKDDLRPRLVDGHTEPLLPVAVLYGANASGKSNVLNAIMFMREAVNVSHRFWSPDDGVPRSQFAWGPKKLEPSLFEVTVVINGTRYCYGFEATDEAFTEEWLYAWPNGKKQMWLEREGMSFKFGDHFKGENKLIEEVTRPNALFLSVAAQHRHPSTSAVFSWFRSLYYINISSCVMSYPRSYQFEMIARMLDDKGPETRQASLFPYQEESQEPLIERFRTLVRNADVGIVDFRVSKADGDTSRRARERLQIQHQSGTDDAWLPLEEESRGTQTLFRIGLPILRAIRDGNVLVIDELEASLHPMLAQHIVRQFNNPNINTRNAQLIFTTHDTNLLGSMVGEPALRRDQVWLTEKDAEGATVVYPLTDYKPRKSENLERGYLQGRFGAIPFLGNLSLADE